jgi:hypothetical protein
MLEGRTTMIRTETSKLRTLRSKTDQQLLELLSRTLEQAREWSRDPASRSRAEDAYGEVRRLLPFLSRLDRRVFEPRVEEVAELLYPPAKAAVCF